MDDNEEIVGIMKSRLDNFSSNGVEHLVQERLNIGRERYGHGVIVNKDTTEFGTKCNNWGEMMMEELLDGLVYACAEEIRNGRSARNDKIMYHLYKAIEIYLS